MINPKSPDYQNHPVHPSRKRMDYARANSGDQPVLTIVTPFFNTGSVFHQTAQSILNQSLQQFEWLIVNDGTTDPDSLAILNSYRSGDARIRVIDHAENRGLSAARNTGCRAAQTSFCLLIDSDDLIEPTTAEKWYWFLCSHPEFSFVSSYSVGFGAHNYLWQSGFQDREANLERSRISTLVLLRKDVHEKVGGFDEEIRGGLEDWDFWLRCADRGYWGTSIPEYLFWYRTRQEHTDRWDNLREERIHQFIETAKTKYPKLWETGFPVIGRPVDLEFERVIEEIPVSNHLSKRKPRLLLVAPWMVIGGAEKFNLDLIDQLNQRGWEVTVATTAPSDNPMISAFEALTSDVFALHNFLDFSDYPRFLRYLIASRQIDAILIASSVEAYRLLPYLRSHCPNIPILDYLHFVTPTWMDGGIPRLSQLYQNDIDLTVTASADVKKWLVGQGTESQKVRVCTVNVDADFWRPDPFARQKLRAELAGERDLPLILYVARLEQQKQPLVFARTMQRLKDAGFAFQALIVGDGSLRQDLLAYLQDNDLLGVVRWMGALPKESVRDLMAASDLLFLPSENEGIALVIYEAMASGLPVIGADVGGQNELVSPDCGLLLPRGDEEGEAVRYAQAIGELIKDLPRLQAMGCAARERVVEHFQLSQMGSRMIELIIEAQEMRRSNLPGETSSELTELVTREAISSMRARYELQNVQRKFDQFYPQYLHMLVDPPMPPASTRTYLYFAFRSFVYPLYQWMQNRSHINLPAIKNKIKNLFIKR
ncbi:MAG TPA: glycosyltransferase [Anaerolineaceae bacterium]|nr:glycosyltransferase [Anaerolineaceae bacterium]